MGQDTLKSLFCHYTGLLSFALEHGFYHDPDLSEADNAECFARAEELEAQLHALAFGDAVPLDAFHDPRDREPTTP